MGGTASADFVLSRADGRSQASQFDLPCDS